MCQGAGSWLRNIPVTRLKRLPQSDYNGSFMLLSANRSSSILNRTSYFANYSTSTRRIRATNAALGYGAQVEQEIPAVPGIGRDC
jgi:hypothetical protein